jgi:hypothetical protein
MNIIQEYMYWAFAVTKFDEIFSGYQQYQVSGLNRRFGDNLGYHHQGSDVWHIPDDDDDDDDDDMTEMVPGTSVQSNHSGS